MGIPIAVGVNQSLGVLIIESYAMKHYTSALMVGVFLFAAGRCFLPIAPKKIIASAGRMKEKDGFEDNVTRMNQADFEVIANGAY
jgi:hypothetical protein